MVKNDKEIIKELAMLYDDFKPILTTQQYYVYIKHLKYALSLK